MCSIQSGRIACIEPIGGARFCKTPGQGFAHEAHARGADHRMLHNARFLPTDGEIYCRARDLCRRRKDAGGRGRGRSRGRDEPVRRQSQDERGGKRGRNGPGGRRPSRAHRKAGAGRACRKAGPRWTRQEMRPRRARRQARHRGWRRQARRRPSTKKPGAFPLPALHAKWWAMQGSNLRPTACKAAALPLRQSPKRWSILPYPARLRKPLVVHDDGVADLDDVVKSRRLRRRQVAAPV